jgi:hypothetical protein
MLAHADRVRKIVSTLPQTVELDHHGIPSFRVSGKIFATLWDPTHLNIMLAPLTIVETTTKENSKSCKEFWWGRQLRCIQIDLEVADYRLVKRLLTEAWSRKNTNGKRVKGALKNIDESNSVESEERKRRGR